MKRAQIILKTYMLLILSIIFLTGCRSYVNGEFVYSYERPAIGFTVEDETVTNLDIQKQYQLNVEAQDGIIKIIRWDKDYLQVIESSKMKGPSSKESLKLLLEKNSCKIESKSYEIKLEKEQDKDLKSLFRRTDDLEIMVPKELTTINISAGSGAIIISGFDEMSGIDLKLEKGTIKVDNCNANRISADVTKGDINIMAVNGAGSYKCGRGDIKLQDITGTVEIKSVSGNTNIENITGKLNVDISAGSITINKSQLKADSMIYASSGDIEVDLEGLESTGKYTIKAANGDIRLNMPEETGWSLLAKSTKGKIADNLNLTSDELEKASSGELYGDVRGGGPTIDVYVDKGDIELD